MWNFILRFLKKRKRHVSVEKCICSSHKERYNILFICSVHIDISVLSLFNRYTLPYICRFYVSYWLRFIVSWGLIRSSKLLAQAPCTGSIYFNGYRLKIFSCKCLVLLFALKHALSISVLVIRYASLNMIQILNIMWYTTGNCSLYIDLEGLMPEILIRLDWT